MPTFSYIEGCGANITSCNCDFVHTYNPKRCTIKNDTVIVVDKACPGCARHIEAQNVWHIVTKLYTAWTTKLVFNTTTYVKFGMRSPLGRISNELWHSISPSTSYNTAHFCNVVVLRKSTPPPTRQVVGYAKLKMPDKLWSLSFVKHKCFQSSSRLLWAAFVQSLVRSRVSDAVRPVQSCFLLRKPLGATRPPSRKKNQRVEANASLLIREYNMSPLFFTPRDRLEYQIRAMRACKISVGIHGAQMMNVMWMQGEHVIEYDYANSIKYYYKNIAELAGATHVKRTICLHQNTSCSSYLTETGVIFNVDFMHFS